MALCELYFYVSKRWYFQTLVGLPVAVLGIFTCAQMLVTVAHTVRTVNVIGAVGTQEILC